MRHGTVYRRAAAVSSDPPSALGGELPNDNGQFTIQQVSRLLGVPAPTLRSWERRYEIAVVDRSVGGHRRYSPLQVRMLRRMRDAIAQGQSAADAAMQVKSAGPSFLEPQIQQFLDAAHRLDSLEIIAVLDRAKLELGLGRTVDEVVFPAMQQIGRDWRIGRCDVAHEHLATETTSSWLSRLGHGTSGASPGQPPGRRPILLACGPRDHHTLGLECMTALLRGRGWSCCLLGATLPVQSLHHAIAELDPAAVVLVSHLSVGRRSAVEALQVAAAAGGHVFYAGNAFLSRKARQGVPGRHLGDNVSRAADLIISTVSRSAASRSESDRHSPADESRGRASSDAVDELELGESG